MRLKHSIMDRKLEKMSLLYSSDNLANSKCRLMTILNNMRVPSISMSMQTATPDGVRALLAWHWINWPAQLAYFLNFPLSNGS